MPWTRTPRAHRRTSTSARWSLPPVGNPYPLDKLEDLGGSFDDVIANVHMERLVETEGPTAGKILRPSTGEPPTKDRLCPVRRITRRQPPPLLLGHLLPGQPQAGHLRQEQLPDAEVTMYYIDRRTPGRNEDVLLKVAELEGVNLVKGKVGEIEQANGALKLHVEDVDNDTADRGGGRPRGPRDRDGADRRRPGPGRLRAARMTTGSFSTTSDPK